MEYRGSTVYKEVYSSVYRCPHFRELEKRGSTVYQRGVLISGEKSSNILGKTMIIIIVNIISASPTKLTTSHL